ncbi:hypothetical protein ACFOQM_24030 [Paenibacillus sp. GCM10012307]|uniref:Uncharacterized protein n=1 Tax=Paenibacillus roseus TaxID=2798579 RepID=A0A934J3Y2_9BACL|nr:hypothetical protein [Paenibacillus roseus]MBJ6364292.1 hypothetical protein [Paenibacillus roseus]
MKKKWVSYLTATVLLFTSITVVQGSYMKAASSSPPPVPSELEAQATIWKREIARQEPFQSWKTAQTDISALGPGTHSWLVNLNLDGKIVGYMIIHARPEGGYQLGEYGLGDEPLYSYQSLYRSLVQLAIIPSVSSLESGQAGKVADHVAEQIYVDPLHAVWKVEPESQSGDSKVIYVDAKTAEQLPYTDQLPKARAKSVQTPLDTTKTENVIAISHAAYLPEFDAYDSFPWLTKAPLDVLQKSLAKQLDQNKRLIFTSEPWDSALRYVWAVNSYHLWNDNQLYVGVDQNGLRYIPFNSLVSHGSFYELS